jgi:hypothetical protein
LRGTKIHPKKPAFLRPIKSFIFLKYMPRLHLLPSRISKFSRGEHLDPPTNQEGGHPHPRTYGARGHAVSTYFQKFSIYLKTFWEPCFEYWFFRMLKHFFFWIVHPVSILLLFYLHKNNTQEHSMISVF